jgi:hypoxanthine phosphoribosyltransferase
MRTDRHDIERVLIGKDEIKKRVDQLGQTLALDYEGKNPLVLGILKGANIFVADLIRAMDIELELDFLILESYGHSDTPGAVVLKRDCETNMEGRDIIIVDDIADTGQTLETLKKLFAGRGAVSVKTCVLLDKPARRKVDCTPDYLGFSIEDHFVVGYGLDYAERFRNLPGVCTLKKHVYGAI